MKATILIAGATGATGSVATKRLLAKGYTVRALVHREDDRSRDLQALGAEVAIGDYLDFPAMRRAFVGVQRAYFVYPMRPAIVQATTHFAEAALEAKAEFIVNMSQRTSRRDSKSECAVQHWLAERVFVGAGTSVCHLRPTAFNEWLLYMRKGIGTGKYDVPFGPTGRFAPVSARDQGELIAAILGDPSSHEGKTYELFGPEELTPPQIAEIVGKTLGKEVRYTQTTGERWVSDITGGAKIPFLDQHLDGIVFDHTAGGMAGTNDNIARFTGHAPETVAAFVERHRHAFV
jgi:NAD(P)H dehydrogenase (quinone)